MDFKKKMDSILDAFEKEPGCDPESTAMWSRISQQINVSQPDALKNEFCSYICSLKRRQTFTTDESLALSAVESSFLDRIDNLQFEFVFPPFMESNCRACLKETNDLVDVFALDESLLRIFTSIMKISKDDGFSQQICGTCLKIVESFSESLLVWERNQTLLMDRLSSQLKEDLEAEVEMIEEVFVEETFVPSKKKPQPTERIYECQICSYRGNTRANLRSHLKSHSEKKAYECRHCSAEFKTSSNLAKHVRNVHDGVKKFKCDQCSRSFSTKDSALKHTVTHSKAKIFACPVCPSTYAWYNGLQKHLKTVHPGKKSITEKSFMDQTSFFSNK